MLFYLFYVLLMFFRFTMSLISINMFDELVDCIFRITSFIRYLNNFQGYKPKAM